MVDLKLTEIFSTVGVGIFVGLCAVYLFFVFQRLFDIRRHNKSAFVDWLKRMVKVNYKESILAIILILLVYVSGLLTQDLTDHMTDTENNNPLIGFVKKINLLKSEGELRKKALIKNDSILTPLGKEVFSNYKKMLKIDSLQPAYLSQFKFEEWLPADSVWREIGKNPLVKERLNDFVGNLYYTSKNWCYLEGDRVHQELEDIQERIDFSRSICAVSFFSASILVLLYSVYYIKEMLRRKNRRFKVISVEKYNEYYYGRYSRKTTSFKKVFNPVFPLIILTTIIWFSQICYTAAEKNFNERAMGYYVSQFKFSKEKTSN